MALVADGGGGGRAPLGVGGSLAAGVSTDEDERRRLAALAAAASQARHERQNVALPSPTKVLQQPDATSTIMRSINFIGGPAAYSMRVDRFAKFWQDNFGVPILPTIALDLARLPMPDIEIERALLNSKASSSVYRGLISPEARQLVGSYAQAGVLYLGDRNKMTQQRKVEEEWKAQGMTPVGETNSALFYDVAWNTPRKMWELYKQRAVPYGINRVPAPLPVPDGTERPFRVITNEEFLASMQLQLGGAGTTMGLKSIETMNSWAGVVTAALAGKGVYDEDIRQQFSQAMSLPMVALNELNKKEQTLLLFFYEAGKHAIRPALGWNVGWELKDLGIDETMSYEDATAKLAGMGITRDMKPSEIAARIDDLGIEQETGLGRAWTDAAAAINRGQDAFGAMTSNAFGWDMQKEMPLTTAMLDIMWSASLEWSGWMLIKPGITKGPIPKVTSWGLNKVTPLEEISTAVAKQFDPAKVGAMTGLSRFPKLCIEMAEETEPLKVKAIMERAFAETTAVVKPDDYMLWRQVKLAIRTNPTFQHMPKTMRRLFQLTPETDLLRVGDEYIYQDAMALCDAFNFSADDTFKMVSKAMSVSEKERGSVFKEIWEMADPKKIEKARQRQELLTGIKRGQPLVAKEQKPIYAANAWMLDADKKGIELSFTTPPEALETELGRQAYLQSVDELYTEYAASEKARVAAASLPEAEQAAALKQIQTLLDKAVENIQVNLTKHMKDLEYDDLKVQHMARDIARAKQKELGPEIHQFINDHGGVRWSDDFEARWVRLNPEKAAKGPSAVEHWARDTNYTFRSDGLDPSEMAYAIESRYGTRAGIKTEEDLWEYFQGNHPNPEMEKYLGDAEAQLILAQGEAGYPELSALEKQLAELAADLKTGKVHPDQLFSSVDKVKAELETCIGQLGELNKGNWAPVPTPLLPYQTVKYWRPDVSLQFIVPEFSGITGKMLDEINRGIVVSRAGAPIVTVGSVASGLTAGTLYHWNDPDAEWTRVAAVGLGVGALTGAAALVGVKNFMKMDADVAMKITPNIDRFMYYWRNYALGAIGVRIRILMDEPFRMMMEGYGWNAVKAWGKGPTLRALENSGKYLAPFSEDAGETMLSYLWENMAKSKMGVIQGTEHNWPMVSSRVFKILSHQRPINVWVEAVSKEGGSLAAGREALAEWAATPVGRAHIARAGYRNVNAWINTTDQFIHDITHIPVKAGDAVIEGTGKLSAQAAKEWKAYEAVYLDKAKVATPPSWYDPDIHSVRYVRTADMKKSVEPVPFLYRKNQRILDMLDKDTPVTISRKNLKAIPQDERPNLSYRLPYEKGPVTNPIAAAYQHGLDLSDTIARNTRSNVYAVEYSRHLDRLRKAVEDSKGVFTWDEQQMHVIADQYARERVRYMTYQSQRTGAELLLRNIVPFAPAQRDFLRYWGTKAVKTPPLALAWLRLQTLPEQQQWEVNRDWLWGTGRVVDWVLGGDMFGLNIASTTFFTGGAGTRNKATNLSEMNVLSVAENFIPGWGPMVTVPVDWLIGAVPETTGFLQSMPNLSLAGKDLPMFGRVERMIYGTEALLLSMFQKAGMADPNWEPWDLPGKLGRDPDYWLARAQHVMAYLAYQKGMDLATIEKGSTEWNNLLNDARFQIGKQEFMEGLAGWLLPTTPWIRIQEQEDIRAFLNEYHEALNYDTDTLPGDLSDEPMFNSSTRSTETLGSARADEAKIKRATDAVRKKYPDYAEGADLLDAMHSGDEDAIDAAANKNNGSWLGYLVGLTEPTGAELEDYGVVTPEDSFENFNLETHYGVRNRKKLPALSGDIVDLFKKKSEHSIVQDMNQTFDQLTAGLSPESKDYQDLKAALNEDIARKVRQLRGPTYDPQHKKSTEQVVASANAFYVGLPATSEVEKQEKALLDRMGKARGVEYQEKVAQLRETYGDSDAVDLQAKLLLKDYKAEFEDDGLDPKWLSDKEPKTQETIDIYNQYLGMVRDPWDMSEEELASRGVKTTMQTDGAIRAYSVMKLDMEQQLKDAGIQSIWAKGAEANLAKFRADVTALCDSDPLGFGAIYNYYQMETWERLRDYGGEMYDSPAWENFFAFLTRRDAWVDRNVDTQTFYANYEYSTKTELGRRRVQWQNDTLDTLSDCFRMDPQFITQYNKLVKLGQSLWDKRRNW